MSEEIEKIGEQPEGAEVHTAEAGVDNGTEMQEGSPLGKFKNATKLKKSIHLSLKMAVLWKVLTKLVARNWHTKSTRSMMVIMF